MIGPSYTGSVPSPSVVVVVPLKLERIRSAKCSIPEESFIWLKAGSCNKFAALIGSLSTLCTSKQLIHRVSTTASSWDIMTLFWFTKGKDMGPSICSIFS